MNPIRELAAAIREETPDALILVDSVSGLGRGAVRDGRVGRGRRRHRVAEGVDGRARPGDDRRLTPGLVGDGARDDAALLPRPAAHREAAAGGETPFTPAIAVVFQVDEGLRLMAAEGADNIFRRHEACAAAARAGLRGTRLRAVRRRTPLLADGHGRDRARRASIGRHSTARSSAAASCWPAVRAS